jgi:hypothetical protein
VNNSASTLEGVAFETCKPFYEFRITTAIIATIQFQIINIAIGIDVVIIQFILGVIAKHPVWIEGNLKRREIQFGNRSHGCNYVRQADVNDVCVTPDAMFKGIEVDLDGCLMSGEQRFQLLHGYSVILSVVERKVADLQKSKASMWIDIIWNTYLECNTSPIK